MNNNFRGIKRKEMDKAEIVNITSQTILMRENWEKKGKREERLEGEVEKNSKKPKGLTIRSIFLWGGNRENLGRKEQVERSAATGGGYWGGGLK